MAGLPAAQFRRNLRAIINGPQALAFIPAITLGGFWLGGETALLGIALMLPAFIALLGGAGPVPQMPVQNGLNGLGQRETIDNTLEQFMLACSHSGLNTAALVVELDDYNALVSRLGHKACNDVLHRKTGELKIPNMTGVCSD